MKTKKLFSMILVSIFSILLLACPSEDPLTPPGGQFDPGTADFTRFVTLGNSLTAGFVSGSLNENFQVNSYPALIARQLGISDFQQPTVSDPGIPPVLQLTGIDPNTGFPIISQKPGSGAPTNAFLTVPYNNLGIPGATSGDILSTTNGGIFDLILRNVPPAVPPNPATTALQQAIGLQPTFMILWIGSNDVLGAAVSGVAIEGVTITPQAVFQQNIATIVGALRANTNANIVMANIPPVTVIPHVTTIPPEAVGAPPGYLVPLGVLTGDADVLDPGEIAMIGNAIAGFNNTISAVASQNNIPVFDVNTFLQEVHAEGIHVGGVELTTDFITGGLFSLDGVHPTTVGYAVVANGFIEVINEAFSSNVPSVDLGQFLTPPSSETAALQKAYEEKGFEALNFQRGSFRELVKLFAPDL